MARDPFARATKSILRRLGKDALLRGAPAGNVYIEHNVQVYERNNDGEAMMARSVAHIEKAYAPARDDQLVMLTSADGSHCGDPEAVYKVQALVSDDGYMMRRVVLPVA